MDNKENVKSSDEKQSNTHTYSEDGCVFIVRRTHDENSNGLSEQLISVLLDYMDKKITAK